MADEIKWRTVMTNENKMVMELIEKFKVLRKEKGWSKDDAHTIAICAESIQAVALFGDKYTSSLR